MADLFSELKRMSGEMCYTLTRNYPARMIVEDDGITIEYPTGITNFISRSLVMEAIRKLKVKGILTLEEVHEGITDQRGPITDRLMAVLRKLSSVGTSRKPRCLY